MPIQTGTITSQNSVTDVGPITKGNKDSSTITGYLYLDGNFGSGTVTVGVRSSPKSSTVYTHLNNGSAVTATANTVLYLQFPTVTGNEDTPTLVLSLGAATSPSINYRFVT